MAGSKNTRLATRSSGAPTVVSPRNKVNVALPFSMFTVQEPVRMRMADWISLAGLVISVTGFSVLIRQSIRNAPARNVVQPETPTGEPELSAQSVSAASG